jgi:hypothetical protein
LVTVLVLVVGVRCVIVTVLTALRVRTFVIVAVVVVDEIERVVIVMMR